MKLFGKKANRLAAAVVAVVLMLASGCALAQEIIFSIVTSDEPTNVALMDDNGQSLSTLMDMQKNGDQKIWMLRVMNNGAEMAYLYEKDTKGNWLRTAQSYPMSILFQQGSAAQQEAPAVAEAPWPTISYTRWPIGVYPLPDNKRVQSRCGPAKTYHGAGAYKTYKMSGIDAMFIEDGYMLVDLSYTTVGRRCVYFSPSKFYGLDNVPEVELTSVPARTLSKMTPTFGPGKEYDTFDEAIIGAGTKLAVFFEEDGWVFAEFDCELGSVRAWLPVDEVEAVR